MFLFNTLSNVAILFLSRMKYVFLWNLLFPSLYDCKESEKVTLFYKINVLVICDLVKQYFLGPIPPHLPSAS